MADLVKLAGTLSTTFLDDEAIVTVQCNYTIPPYGVLDDEKTIKNPTFHGSSSNLFSYSTLTFVTAHSRT